MANVQLIHKISKLFQPISAVSKASHLENKDALSKSQKLLVELGIIRPASQGHFYFLPLGIRILDKLKAIVVKEMSNINAQRVTFPSLTNARLWKKSGRIEDELSSELFKVHDRHDATYILSPTHEESAADLLASVSQMSYKQFPLRLYQITSKFRDEMKPRFGLIRSREFVMKDLYSFDVNIDKAKESYNEICQSYDRIFKQIGIDVIKVLGPSGNMGGSVSHEYHYVAPIGEDKLLSCLKCGYKANVQLSGRDKCPQCSNTTELAFVNGLEVGHTFLLGDKYSRPLKAFYKSDSDEMVPVQMGSYGLGLSRIVASVVEVLSTEHEIRWPSSLAPFSVVIIPPKAGSKEEKAAGNCVDFISSSLNQIPSLQNDIILDDRLNLTVGKRLMDAKRVGYPYIVVIGSKLLENPPLYELIDVKNDLITFLSLDALFDFFRNRKLIIDQEEIIAAL
ncbi:probable proline--tRNA ligase, mitochondrial [Agrilus planipennis]|uniref:Probable proline--tRNA ligase, mitochondrial n=1 Tax=Agrilus planipennis TaxID=224129 RepID=A0A1W4WLN3_AGRPL|nr:probable proline--tRNA ligase, mitochondrial [Agrilus planipennis]XP_018321362.1 probable proline--tRNA ligase, mitochondrial [Agrilus planipennis]